MTWSVNKFKRQKRIHGLQAVYSKTPPVFTIPFHWTLFCFVSITTKNRTAIQNEHFLSATSMAALIASYVDAIASCSVKTWQDIKKQQGFHKLQPDFEKLFCITATTSHMERIFNKGGLYAATGLTCPTVC